MSHHIPILQPIQRKKVVVQNFFRDQSTQTDVQDINATNLITTVSFEPYIPLDKGPVTSQFVRRLRMVSIIDHYEETGLIRDASPSSLQKRYEREFHTKPPALSSIIELLRSKGFGVTKENKVKLFKR